MQRMITVEAFITDQFREISKEIIPQINGATLRKSISSQTITGLLLDLEIRRDVRKSNVNTNNEIAFLINRLYQPVRSDVKYKISKQ